MAESLCSRNQWIVAVKELRGNASSSWRASRSLDWSYWTIASQDIPANLRKLRSLHPTGPLYLLGHSIGGLMMSLYMSKLSAERNKDLDDIAGILIIASGSAYHKIYPDPRMLLIGWITILVVYILGFFPGKVFKLGGSKEPKSFMLDWTSDIRYGLFNIRECPHNNVHSHLKNIKQPVLFISFDKDSFVPHESASHFASLFPEKQVKHIKVDPQDHEELKHLNRHALHFKWARGEMVLPLIENWIRGTIQTSAHGKQ